MKNQFDPLPDTVKETLSNNIHSIGTNEET